jgi:hypothetical protein
MDLRLQKPGVALVNLRCAMWLWVAVGACCGTAAAATLHVDEFETGTTLGWTGGASPMHVASGGSTAAGPGFLMITSGNNLATHNTTPPWTGNLAAIGADRILVDLMAPISSAPLAIRVVLFGPNSTNQRWTSSLAQTVPNDGVWRSYTFMLGPNDLVAPFPAGTYDDVVASTLRVMLRHDPGDPDYGGTFVTGSLGIDNIELASGAPADTPGDFDADGDVDADDLNDPTRGWKARFGVDLEGQDFLVWQRDLGALGGAATAAVPEPASITLVLAAATLGIWRRTN